ERGAGDPDHFGMQIFSRTRAAASRSRPATWGLLLVLDCQQCRTERHGEPSGCVLKSIEGNPDFDSDLTADRIDIERAQDLPCSHEPKAPIATPVALHGSCIRRSP